MLHFNPPNETQYIISTSVLYSESIPISRTEIFSKFSVSSEFRRRLDFASSPPSPATTAYNSTVQSQLLDVYGTFNYNQSRRKLEKTQTLLCPFIHPFSVTISYRRGSGAELMLGKRWATYKGQYAPPFTHPVTCCCCCFS